MPTIAFQSLGCRRFSSFTPWLLEFRPFCNQMLHLEKCGCELLKSTICTSNLLFQSKAALPHGWHNRQRFRIFIDCSCVFSVSSLIPALLVRFVSLCLQVLRLLVDFFFFWARHWVIKRVLRCPRTARKLSYVSVCSKLTLKFQKLAMLS